MEENDLDCEQLLREIDKLTEKIKELEDSEIKRKKREQSLSESVKLYRSLFSGMDEGLYLHEMVYDESNHPVNYRIIDANPASERHLGIKRDEALNKLATELYGTIKAPFLDIYSDVVKNGKNIILEEYFPPFDKYFRISAFSPDDNLFVTIFTDITMNKKMTEEVKTNHEYLEEIIASRTKELEDKNEELDNCCKMLSRQELKIRELQNEIRILKGNP